MIGFIIVFFLLLCAATIVVVSTRQSERATTPNTRAATAPQWRTKTTATTIAPPLQSFTPQLTLQPHMLKRRRSRQKAYYQRRIRVIQREHCVLLLAVLMTQRKAEQ